MAGPAMRPLVASRGGLDTETTGFIRQSSIVEIAAVRMVSGCIKTVDGCLVRGRPIRPQRPRCIISTQPWPGRRFAAVWPGSSLCRRRGADRPLWWADLAVPARMRTGIARAAAPLDNLLAQSPSRISRASPSKRCLWGVEDRDRHSALGVIGDRAYLSALVPKLRQRHPHARRGDAACRALTEVLDEQHRAGWVEAVGRRSARTGARSTASTAIPIGTCPRRDAHAGEACRPGTSIGDALASLWPKASSLYVPAPPHAISEAAGVADRNRHRNDVLRAIAAAVPPLRHAGRIDEQAAGGSGGCVRLSPSAEGRLKVRHRGGRRGRRRDRRAVRSRPVVAAGERRDARRRVDAARNIALAARGRGCRRSRHRCWPRV